MEATVRGNLGLDPELKTLPSGIVTTRLRIAASQTKTDREKNAPTVWVDAIAYGDLAERCGVLHSGDPVLVTGHWRAEEWQTEDGQQRRRTYVYAIAAGPDLSRCTVDAIRRPAKTPPGHHAGDTPAPDPFDED